jgi:N-methylhydantoinase A
MFFHGIGANRKVEIVSFRVGASSQAPSVHALSTPRSTATAMTHPLYENGRRIDCRHVPAEALEVGKPLKGPAIVSGATATTYIPTSWSATRDAADNILMRRT